MSRVFELTDSNYAKTVENIDKPIFIDFYSPSCGPCLQLLPFLDVLEEYAESKVLIAKVDVSQNPKIAAKYEIRSVPFCVTIGEDKIIKDYELGLADLSRYFKMLDKALGKKEKGFFSSSFCTVPKENVFVFCGASVENEGFFTLCSSMISSLSKILVKIPATIAMIMDVTAR